MFKFCIFIALRYLISDKIFLLNGRYPSPHSPLYYMYNTLLITLRKYTQKCEMNLNRSSPFRHEHIIIKTGKNRIDVSYLKYYQTIFQTISRMPETPPGIYNVYDSCKTDLSHQHCKNKQLETTCPRANCTFGQILNIKSDEFSLRNE